MSSLSTKSVTATLNIVADEKRMVILVLFIGGILSGLCYLFFQFYLGWVILVPLMYALEKANTRQAFLYGIFFGVVTASILYYWVFPISVRYSGRFTMYSVPMYLIAVAYFSLYCGLFGVGYRIIRSRGSNTIIAGLSIAGFYVLLDFLKLKVFSGLPWLQYTLAHTQAQNLWAVQLASIGGMPLIIFFIVFFNYLLTQYLIRRDLLFITAAIGLLVSFFAAGFLITVANDGTKHGTLSAVLINENLSAEKRWDKTTGDSLAHLFFKLNGEAVTYNPELIVWSETAVPWRFELDDDFVHTVLSITYPSKSDHLLGLLTPSPQNKQLVFNSAYLIRYDGRITDRYDKNILLEFLEKPFTTSRLSMLPFASSSMYDNILPGQSRNLIKTGRAHVGVLICNESLSENYWKNYTDAGANLLVLMSNDAWFENTPLIMHHFYITRFAAVCSGRDVVINSNRGISGIIRANGKIEVSEHSDTASVVHVTANPSPTTTFYSTTKDLNMIFYIMALFLAFFSRRKHP